MITPDQIITATIPDFCQMTHLGRTHVYEMMHSGKLQYIKMGKRTLIVVDSYRRLIERQLREGVPPDHSTDAARTKRAANRAAALGPIDLAALGLL